MVTPKEILQDYWGYDSFRNPQEEIINAVVDNKNVIALLPTGGGKSICFQIPALLKEGICIVISPLIALMEDQVTNLKERGLKAMTLPSGASQDEVITLFDNLRFGNYKFLYISPERLQTKFIQQKIAQLNVSLIAIDEAHCISEWGHDFRPSYLKINILKDIHPNISIIALTATATPRVIQDISNTLNFETPTIFKKSFQRNNLAYQIYFTDDKLYKLNQIFTKTKAPAIVYVNTRNRTKEISRYLNANGFESGFYHGGLTPLEKKIAFDNWMYENKPIIVATNAFGMGIDKPNVKVVIHFNLPSSIENYVQEAGRGGRNEQKAFSVVLTNNSDIKTTQELQQRHLPTLLEIKQIHIRLYQYFQIAKGEIFEDVFSFNLLDFCNKYNFASSKTFNALQVLHNNAIIQFDNNSIHKSTVQFLVNSKHMMQYVSQLSIKKKEFITVFLRLYGGMFEQAVAIDESYLSKKARVTSFTVIEYLEKLEEDQVIKYNKSTNNALINFLQPREDNKTINRSSKNIQSYLKQKHSKTTQFINFIKNDSTCRSLQILDYFGEKEETKCGICDVCLAQKYRHKNIIPEIITLLNTQKLSSKEIALQLPFKEDDILINLRNLLSEEKIGLDNYNKYFII